MNLIISGLQSFPVIETMLFPKELDGSIGINRASGNNPQISAQNDVDAIKTWLARFHDTKTTFDSYRKEAERLILWSTIELRKPLSSLTHEDLIAYQNFLKDPFPFDRWVMQQRKVSRNHPNWKPFAGPLSPTSQKQAIVILNGLFTWLVNAGYLSGNPLSLSRNRQRNAKPRITRFLDERMWQEVKVTISNLPKDTSRDLEHFNRTRWLFTLLYITGIRISELTANTMGNFFSRYDQQNQRWWIEITGKGSKTRIVPATQELMHELSKYRKSLGLSLFPIENESTPLILPIGGKNKSMTRSAIHLIIKQIFGITAIRLKALGTDYLSLAEKLELASAHWLRHTAGSNMTTSKMDIRHVRDNLGHQSLTTTNQYLHSEDDKRHADTEYSHKLNWEN